MGRVQCKDCKCWHEEEDDFCPFCENRSQKDLSKFF